MLILLNRIPGLIDVCSCLGVNSDNNNVVSERTIEQVVHQQGGPEKCPWTNNIMEGSYQHS